MSDQSHDIRWVQRLDSFSNALAQLDEAVSLAVSRPLSKLERQGLIQGFEFTHELSWKLLKDFLEERGNTGIYGSKDAIREAVRAGFLDQGEVWMDMIASRNLSSHTYNETIARDIEGKIIQSYATAFNSLASRFGKLLHESER